MNKIVISYSDKYTESTYNALSVSDIKRYLDFGFNVSLKPNLVAAGPASNGAITHPEVTEGIIIFLRDYGVKNIKIIECSGIGQSTTQAFKYCGYEELSKKHNVPLIDLRNDSYKTISNSGYDLKVCSQVLDTDFLINIPVLKAHCQTRFSCCLKNLKGCIPDSEKKRYHTLGIHKPVAALNSVIKTGYCVVDGICGDLSFEEGGNPVTANRIVVGKNPVTVDSFCVEYIGYKPDDIEYLAVAKKLGVGEYYSDKTEVLELGSENKPKMDVKRAHTADRYRHLIDERDACSVCYASLIHALHKCKGNFHGFGTRSSTLPGAMRGDKICIGQGFASQTRKGFGVGDCTRGFSTYVPGCPAKATDIIKHCF